MEVQVPGGAAPLQEGESFPHVLPVRQPRLQVSDITIITWTKSSSNNNIDSSNNSNNNNLDKKKIISQEGKIEPLEKALAGTWRGFWEVIVENLKPVGRQISFFTERSVLLLDLSMPTLWSFWLERLVSNSHSTPLVVSHSLTLSRFFTGSLGHWSHMGNHLLCLLQLWKLVKWFETSPYLSRAAGWVSKTDVQGPPWRLESAHFKAPNHARQRQLS